MPCDIEGTLWKWTNYFTGWQSRWFVLENGILSYYRSQDDVTNGCKGSIKMSVCDVNVHATDNTRLDLIIPGEAHFYIKAATSQERQLWLVALGSSKAGLQTLNGVPSVNTGEKVQDELRIKKSELRLYCDLLMQQVHSIKQAVAEKEHPNEQALSESSSLLSATCDTFINSLEDCMQLVHAHVGNVSSIPTSPNSPVTPLEPMLLSGTHEGSPSRRTHGNVKTSTPRPMTQRQTSVERVVPQMRSNRPKSQNGRSRTPSESSVSSAERSAVLHESSIEESGTGLITDELSDLKVNDDKQAIYFPTLFSEMSSSFRDIIVMEDGGIPVLPFLNSCKAILVIFDKLSSTAFIPVKLDITGNIRKINEKYSTDPNLFTNLQLIVLHEVSCGQSNLSQSATIALLWLKRALEFIRELLLEFANSSSDMSACASVAYGRTLRQYHGMVIRGVFALAVKAVPLRSHFVTQLAMDASDAEHPNFEPYVLKEVENYVKSLDSLLDVLNEFYKNQHLSLDEKI